MEEDKKKEHKDNIKDNMKVERHDVYDCADFGERFVMSFSPLQSASKQARRSC